MTILRGKVIVRDGELLGSSSDGRWLSRKGRAACDHANVGVAIKLVTGPRVSALTNIVIAERSVAISWRQE